MVYEATGRHGQRAASVAGLALILAAVAVLSGVCGPFRINRLQEHPFDDPRRPRPPNPRPRPQPRPTRPAPPSSDARHLDGRRLGPLRGLCRRDPHLVRDGPDDARHRRDAAPVHPGAVRRDRRLRRRPEAADRLPDRVPRRHQLRAGAGRRGADPVLRPVRAPRPAVLRAGVHRVRRPRADHRHQQADPAGPGRDAAVRRPGADDARDRRRARVDARARTASPSTSRPTTCARRCAGSASTTR